MAIKFSSILVLIGMISTLLFLSSCTTPPECPPCDTPECETCEVCTTCEVCEEYIPPTDKEAYVIYECIPLTDFNELVDTTNGLVKFINEQCSADNEKNLTELPYLTIEEVGE